MSSWKQHGLLEYQEQEEPAHGAVLTRAIRYCGGCGERLATAGGGGFYLCRPCWDTLRGGALTEIFREERLARDE